MNSDPQLQAATKTLPVSAILFGILAGVVGVAVGLFAEQHMRGGNHAGRAEAALQRVMLPEGRLQRGKAFVVGQPIAHLSRLHAFFVEEAPGISLQQILLQGDDPVAAVGKVARALAAFHQGDVPTGRSHSYEHEISDLKQVRALLESICPQLSADVRGIISAVAMGLAEVPPAPTHRDLKAEHIFLDGDRVSFIALNAFAGADPVLDSAEVLAHLAAMPSLSLLPRSRARRAAQAFAKEYFAQVPKSWRSRSAFHTNNSLNLLPVRLLATRKAESIESPLSPGCMLNATKRHRP